MFKLLAIKNTNSISIKVAFVFVSRRMSYIDIPKKPAPVWSFSSDACSKYGGHRQRFRSFGITSIFR